MVFEIISKERQHSMCNEEKNITVSENDGSSFSVLDERIEIKRKNKIKRIPFSSINRCTIINLGKSNQSILIRFDRTLIWGEDEITFPFSSDNLENAQKAVSQCERFMCGANATCLELQNECGALSLAGENASSISIEADSLIVCKKNKKKAIPFDVIKDIYVDNDDSLPHLTIVHGSSYIKGNREIHFYYVCDSKIAEDFTIIAKQRILKELS